jgi:LPXTG-motif cell wall-anchored protein
MRYLAPLFLLLMVPGAASAAKFSNQFTEFELPPKWQCQLEGAEWVCQSTDEGKKRDALIVLAAKLKGDNDSLESFQKYLEAPRTFTAPNGKATTSAPRYTKTLQINQHPWMDSLHLESEVPGFYTRYLATVKQDIAVLVTYSINKTKYTEYQGQFDEMVKSMKVFRKQGVALNQGSNGSLFNSTSSAISGSQLFNPDASSSPKAAAATDKPKTNTASGGDSSILIILLVGVVGFIIWKKKKQQQG